MARKRKKKRSALLAFLKSFMSTSLYLLLVLFLTYLMLTYVCKKAEVEGESMETTLYDGQQLMMDKLTYRFNDPERFDIIVFPYQHGKRTLYVKRIIGLPGEKIRIDDEGTIYIDGEVLDEHYGREVIEDPGLAVAEITLSEDEYFVLGDNRNYSVDSRFVEVGAVKKADILGRVVFRIWPLDTFGPI